MVRFVQEGGLYVWVQILWTLFALPVAFITLAFSAKLRSIVLVMIYSFLIGVSLLSGLLVHLTSKSALQGFLPTVSDQLMRSELAAEVMKNMYRAWFIPGGATVILVGCFLGSLVL